MGWTGLQGAPLYLVKTARLKLEFSDGQLRGKHFWSQSGIVAKNQGLK